MPFIKSHKINLIKNNPNKIKKEFTDERDKELKNGINYASHLHYID